MSKKINLNGLDVFLMPQKVVFIPRYDMIILSDWHIGKLGHFRKEGLFVPPMQLEEEFARLAVLVEELLIRQVVFLGDLFHSSWNYEWDEFQKFLGRYPGIRFTLTRGNHDILPDALWRKSILHVKEHVLLSEGILFSHEPMPNLDKGIINVVGHLHPGCEVATRGRQFFKLPCFYWEEGVLTLPAFGRWTGLFLVGKRYNNRIFAVVGNEVVELK
ncbi:ligase-associated DNA damage response endonuclease PdeM [Sphingobacterium suaedae]|uniref:Ligase-associated DNA damage response endonuclease PdeM n=1 Tax=Sphingobacterium suaedae TaxID=1686402 RepID=A0ABW5KBI0_9SPHI